MDGWPLVGENGRAVVTHKKPDVGKKWPVAVLPTSDEFATPTLGLQWAWNHNPDTTYWSLTARPGYLRLQTAKVVTDLSLARNTLTQRPFGPASSGTARLDVSAMREGDIAGLAFLQEPYGYVGVQMRAGKKQVVMVHDGREVGTRDLPQADLYLRANVDALTDLATFAYSLDGTTFQPLGDTLALKYSLKYFVGNKFCLFNYATQALGGQVDFDWFRVKTPQGPPNLFAATSRIQAERYDHLHQTHVALCPDGPPKEQCLTDLRTGSWLQFDQLDFGPGVHTMQARVAAGGAGGTLEIHLDSPTGPLLGRCPVASTGGWEKYATVACPVAKVQGKYAVVLRVTGGDGHLLNLNWFSFQGKVLSTSRR